MSYAKALAKLESLPADERELASGRYVYEIRDGKPHCGCAIGKLLTEEQRARLVRCTANEGNVSDLRRWLADPDPAVPLPESVEGLAVLELRDLQYRNDRAAGKLENSDASRKERYRLVIAWLREQVAKETK